MSDLTVRYCEHGALVQQGNIHHVCTDCGNAERAANRDLYKRQVAIAALFGNDLARAQEAAKMVEAIEWLFANRIHVLIEEPGGQRHDGDVEQKGWWLCPPDGKCDSTGSTLPEAVSALKAKLGTHD